MTIFCLANLALVLAVWILPGPGLYPRAQLDNAGIAPSIQHASLAILAPAALLAIVLAVFNLRAKPELDPA